MLPVDDGGRRRRLAAGALAVSLAYYFGARIGFALTLHPHPVSTLWPPNAILLAALLLTPIRTWWIVLLAALPAHLIVELQSGVPMPMVLAWFLSNCSEALIGAAGVRCFVSRPVRLDSFARVGVFVAFAGFLAPFLSSFLDAAFVVLIGWGTGGYWDIWRTRFFANFLASLTLVPVIVTAVSGGLTSLRHAPARRLVEAGVLAVALTVTCVVVFVAEGVGPGTSPALLYAPLPLLLWATVRLGPGGTSASILAFAFLAIWGVSHGRGPFIASSPAENALSIQIFLIVISIPLMALAAVLEERRRAEDAARQSEERLSIAVNAAQLGTWDWNISDDVAEVSGATRKILGLTDDVPVSFQLFLKHVHPDDRDHVARQVWWAVAKREPFEFEYRVVRQDGSQRWVLSKGKPVPDETGAATRMIGVNVDITDRKRVELDAQEHRRELAHLGRVALVGELSGALAHELNQPLAAILTNARAAQRFLSHDPPDLAQLHDILGSIVEDDRRASDVISRLRTLLRKDTVRLELLAPNEIVRDVLGIARGDLLAREVSVTTELASDLPKFAGDRVQLLQVMLNLVLNACDAMHTKPPGLRRLTLKTAHADGEGVRMLVSDTGTGIPHENIEHIFEPFVTSKAQGLGLGLSICRSIVFAHDGRLWAENNPQGGATFHLTLPIGSETAPSTQ
jgi:PAS domain S-box-containing protein